MAQFAKNFKSALDSSDYGAYVTEARDAFATNSDETRDLVLHLQSDEHFLEDVLDHLKDESLSTAQAVDLLELVFCGLYSSLPMTVVFVRSWMQYMRESSILRSKSYSLEHAANRDAAEALAVLICLEIIGSARNVALDEQTLESEFFLSSPQLLEELHSIVLELSQVEPLVGSLSMAWGIFLHSLILDLADEQMHDPRYQTFFDHVFAGDQQEPHRRLIERALSGNLYQEIAIVNTHLPTKHNEKYRSILLTFFLDTQAYAQFSEQTTELFSKLVTSKALASAAWENPATVQLLSSSRQQFPHKFRPLIRMVSSLAFSAARTVPFMDNIPSFTQVAPAGFKNYETLSEDTEQTLIETNQVLEFLTSRTGGRGIAILPGTRGIMIPESHGRSIVLWQFQYSALQYLAQILQMSAEQMNIIKHTENAAEIIVLFTRLIADYEDVDELLGAFAENDTDLPTTVFQIYEQLLLAQEGVEVLVEALRFFETLLLVSPSTAWPFVARLTLADRLGTLDALSDFTVAREASGQSIWIATAFCSLVHAAVSSHIRSALDAGDRLLKAKAHFMHSSIQYLSNCYRAYLAWVVIDVQDRYVLGAKLSTLFAHIVGLQIDNHLSSSVRTQHVETVLDPGAKIIIAEYGATSSLAMPLRNQIQYIAVEALSSHDGTRLNYIQSTFRFYHALLRVPGREGSYACQTFREVCFSAFPDLVSAWSKNKDHRHMLTKFMLQILRSEGPPLSSILSALGAEKVSFRTELFKYIKTGSLLMGDELDDLWLFISCLIQPEQAGLAMYLLDKSDATSTKNDLLSYVTENLRDITLSQANTRIMSRYLRVLLDAQYWALVVHEHLKDDAPFWAKLHELLETCNAPLSNQADELVTVMDADRMVAAGLVAKVLAGEINCLDKKARLDMVMTVIQSLDRLAEDVLVLQHYRASLHGNLTRNVSQKYPGFSLSALSTTNCVNHIYGDSFCYDLELATNMIQANSFLRELRTANLNLSLMDGQGNRISGLYILLSASVLSPITKKSQWQYTHRIVHNMLRSSFHEEIPFTKSLVRETLSTASSLIYSLCSSTDHTDADGLISILDDLTLKLGQSDKVEAQDARTITQLICQVLNAISELSLPRSLLPLLQRQVSQTFGQVICIHGPKYIQTLRHSHAAHAGEQLSILIVVGRLISSLAQKHALPPAPFASELVQSSLLSDLVGFFSSIEDISPESQASSNAYSALQMLLMLHSVTKASTQFMHAGLFRMLLESRLCLTIQSKGSSGTVDLFQSLWVSSILPLQLCMINSLGVRIKDETEILINAYHKRIQSSISCWTKPRNINSTTTQELVLTLLLTGSYDNMLQAPDEEYATTKSVLADRLDYLITHPKTTSALTSPGDDESQITKDLQTAVEILRTDRQPL